MHILLDQGTFSRTEDGTLVRYVAGQEIANVSPKVAAMLQCTPLPEPTQEPTQEPTPEPTQEPTPEPTQESKATLKARAELLGIKVPKSWPVVKIQKAIDDYADQQTAS